MEIWTATRSLRVAAAFGTLGVPIRIEKMIDERTGRANETYYLGLSDSMNTFRTKAIKDRYENGDLERDEPGHHLLDALAGMHNRDMILDATEKGKRIHLVKVPRIDRSLYVEGESGFLGIGGHPAVIRTGDLKLVAALGRIGVPILWVEGQKGSRNYLLPASWSCFGVVLDVAMFVKRFREKTLEDLENPFFYALGGLRARERMLDARREEREMVLIRKPNSAKAAFVDPDSTNVALDKMRKFFNS